MAQQGIQSINDLKSSIEVTLLESSIRKLLHLFRLLLWRSRTLTDKKTADQALQPQPVTSVTNYASVFKQIIAQSFWDLLQYVSSS